MKTFSDLSDHEIKYFSVISEQLNVFASPRNFGIQRSVDVRQVDYLKGGWKSFYNCNK